MKDLKELNTLKTLINKMAWKGSPGHEPKGETQTIQGEVLPMKNILLRYASGIDVAKHGGFYGDVEDDEHESPDFNDVVNADAIDQQEMAEQRIALIEVIEAKKAEAEAKKKVTVEKKPETPAG